MSSSSSPALVTESDLLKPRASRISPPANGDSANFLPPVPAHSQEDTLLRHGVRGIRIGGGEPTSLNPTATEFVPTSGAPPTPSSSSNHRANDDDAVPIFKQNEDMLSSVHQYVPRKHSQCPGGGGLSAVLKKDHGGVAKADHTSFRTAPSSSGNPAYVGSQASGKRSQYLNANHLLNFHYDPIPRPQRRLPPPLPRKHYRPQPYNKDMFLQANFSFLASDLGDYGLNASDPDKMLKWEDIAAVNVSAPNSIQCPICLESPPLCPQIASCGHIFCFPCILRYFMIGEDEQKSDYTKKCPLCFTMISSKDLRTVFIINVNNYTVGDSAVFSLLMRAKDSIIPFERSAPFVGLLPSSEDWQCYPFSKITLISDAQPIASKAVSELEAWAGTVHKYGGEDLDLLPYVFRAVDLLQQRSVAWTEHRALEFLSVSPPVRERIMAQTKQGLARLSFKQLAETEGDLSSTEVSKEASKRKQGIDKADVTVKTQVAMEELREKSDWVYESPFSDDENSCGSPRPKPTAIGENYSTGSQSNWVSPTNTDFPSGGEESSGDTENFKKIDEKKGKEVKKDAQEIETYTFYQAADGQLLIMHPLSMKCLLQYYGSYDKFPLSFEAKIVEMETLTQTEVTRKRYRYLSHLPLTTTFKFCEVDLHKILPSGAFCTFGEELRIRENRRRRRHKQEQEGKAKEESRTAASIFVVRPPPPEDFVGIMDALHDEELPSSMDFEGLGDSQHIHASPPMDERRLFSNVAKLGFASAHDAPALTSATDSGHAASSSKPLAYQDSNVSLETNGGKGTAMSFADIIQSHPSRNAETNDTGRSKSGQSSTKKGKKPAKVLFSTGGGRRY